MVYTYVKKKFSRSNVAQLSVYMQKLFCLYLYLMRLLLLNSMYFYLL